MSSLFHTGDAVLREYKVVFFYHTKLIINWFRPSLVRQSSSTYWLCSYDAYGKLLTELLMAFFEKQLSSCYSSLRARLVECMTNSCVGRFLNLRCWYLQVVSQSCLSEQFSLCMDCLFRWTSMSWEGWNCVVFTAFLNACFNKDF